MEQNIKKVALHDIHQALGAKMIPFAGFMMPVRYTSDIEEHEAVRKSVGVFDVSHMGEFMVTGQGALDLIQKVTSNDASKLNNGKVQYSCLPNDQGGIVDDLLVYRFEEEKYMLVVNASNIEKDWNWINSFNTFGAQMENISFETSLLAVQGPKATETLQKLTEVNLSELKYYTFTVGAIAGIENVIISATGYTGSGGFELYVSNQDAEKLWKAVFESGAEYSIKPTGLGARDTLRLEMGFCLYGNDINDTTSPLEAGLGWITKFSKEFINSDRLKKQKEAGVNQKLVGFEMIERGIPRAGYKILNENDDHIGQVTSGTMSPSLQKGIGLGYVNIENSKADTPILIGVRNRKLKGRIVKLPFYQS